MENNKLETISKLFEGKEIRSIWDSEKEDYFFSVVDVIKVLTDSNNANDYWYRLKKRMTDEERSEISTKCRQLKLKSKDGKNYLTDTLDTKGILDRNKLTDIWKENGISENYEFAVLTNEIYKTWSGMKASEYKEYKNIRKESLRDNMTDVEVVLTDLGEIATRELAKEHNPYGLEQNKKIAKAGGQVAKTARDDLEQKLGRSIISNENNLNYKYLEVNKNVMKKIESKNKN